MKTMTTLLTVGAVAAGVFLLFRNKDTGGLSFASLPLGRVIYGSNGSAYVATQRPANSWESALADGTINLANSSQIIRPATALDLLLGSPL